MNKIFTVIANLVKREASDYSQKQVQPTPEKVESASRSISHSSVGEGSEWGQPHLSQVAPFVLSTQVAQKFNAYATAAYPYEIGGMLRVIEREDGVWEAIDIKIFKQQVSPVYFELDGAAVATFNMGLFQDGKKDELPQWRSLIHSHPSMTPFMSGPDKENIVKLAGKKFAFSVICSAHENPEHNYFAVHYAQTAPTSIMIEDMKVHGQRLSGFTDLDDITLKAIEIEVETLCDDMHGKDHTRPYAESLIEIRDETISQA